MAKSITVKNTTIGEGVPCICVPLTGSSLAELLEEAQEAAAVRPDLVEWRADFFKDLFLPDEVAEVLEKLCGILGEIPLIFTVRTSEEGGNLRISAEKYIRLLKDTAATGWPSLIDVEILQLAPAQQQDLISAIHQQQIWIIGSSHHFERTPSNPEMKEILQKEDEAGADILKLAVMPRDYGDVARLLQVTGESSLEKPVITMSMGEKGSASRFCGEIFGSAVTFATVKRASAPGQLPIGELRQMLAVFHDFVKN